MTRAVPWLPADHLAAMARVHAEHERKRTEAARVPATLAADIEKLRAAREVLSRRRAGWPSTTNDIDRQIEKLSEQLAEVAA